MHRRALIVALIASLSALAGAAAAAGTPDIAILPASKWRVEAAAGDRVTLAATGDILTVQYDVNVDRTHQIGHKTLNQVSFRLLLADPVPLDEAQRRIIFEAAGLDDHHPDSNRRLLVSPVITDGKGEYLIYAPKRYIHLKSGGTGWSMWMSSDFYAGEAGGATQDVFEAEGGDRNSWPDGRLSFAGFQVGVRAPKFGRQRGGVRLGRVLAGGLRIPVETPFAYADSFLKDKGTYRLAAAVCNEFQGVPIREIDHTLVYDPDDFASRRQRLEFPLGPDDNYWIDYQITDAAGKVVQADSMRCQVSGSPDRTPPAPVDVTKAPALGNLRVRCGGTGRGVYQRGEPLTVQARVFAKGARQLKLEWTLTPWMFAEVLDQGARTIAFGETPFEDVSIELKSSANRDAYGLHLTVKDGDKPIDTRTWVIGYRTDLSRSHDRPGSMTKRDELKQHAYNRTTYLPEPKGFATEDAAVAHFREALDGEKRMADNVTYMIDLADFEVLPGVFDFSLLDRIMDTAADQGCKITVRFAHSDNTRTYLWPKYSRQFNYDGTEIALPPYGAYAVSDPRTTTLWLDAYRALFQRYRRHTAFQGYYIMQPGGEWTVADKPWEGVIAGYSPAAALGFRSYLRDNMKLSLADVNKRWGQNYASWDDIQPPLPELKLGAKPDLRMQWVDFCRFKRALGTEVWFPLAVNSIREYDPDRVTIIYGTPKFQKLLYGKLDYCHNGGNERGHDQGQYIDAWENGRIGWITEPHHPHRWAAYGDPAQRGWVLDWSVWVMISQAGGGGANLHIYYFPGPTLDLAAHYGGAYAYDRFETYKPILEELLSLKLQEPPIRVAVLHDPYTLYCKHRTTFGARLEDLKRWLELCKDDAVLFEELTPERAENYRLVLPNILDEVMSAENIETLDRLVRGGARTILCANTGSYSPELGAAPFQLLRKLGIAPPAGPYVQDRKDVAAEVVADHPLFAKGDKVPFFSLADLQSDLQSPAVKEAFWRYPYRWIPQTDYFGVYAANRETNGVVLARFADGGVALSKHQVGKGEAIVLWGTPDLRDGKMKGLMARAAVWADAVSPRYGSPIPRTLEGHSSKLGRHYALLWQETPGTYTQKLSTVPDGQWFLDDMVSAQKLGTYTGRELREKGLEVTFIEGYSPLKVVRMMPVKDMRAEWIGKYRQPPRNP